MQKFSKFSKLNKFFIKTSYSKKLSSSFAGLKPLVTDFIKYSYLSRN